MKELQINVEKGSIKTSQNNSQTSSPTYIKILILENINKMAAGTADESSMANCLMYEYFMRPKEDKTITDTLSNITEDSKK
jgi:hypothetical protein